MIKRIIFDIDNTLIQWESSYYANLGKVFERLALPYQSEEIEKVVEAIDEYEQRENYFQKEAMQHLIEEKLRRTLPNRFVDVMLDYFATCVPEKLPVETIETLEYLSQKYELVTLSNWFEKTQTIRMEKVGIKQYFKQIYACETIKIKPNAESYYAAAGNQKREECLMIGDNIITDIQGAEKCGMQVIWYNPNRVPTSYPNIVSLKELKERL